MVSTSKVTVSYNAFDLKTGSLKLTCVNGNAIRTNLNATTSLVCIKFVLGLDHFYTEYQFGPNPIFNSSMELDIGTDPPSSLLIECYELVNATLPPTCIGYGQLDLYPLYHDEPKLDSWVNLINGEGVSSGTLCIQLEYTPFPQLAADESSLGMSRDPQAMIPNYGPPPQHLSLNGSPCSPLYPMHECR